MKEKAAESPPAGRRVEQLVGPDFPLVFRVDFFVGRSRWGVAKPTEQPQHGRAIQMLDGHGYGWWYANKTLDESVKNLFHSGVVEQVQCADLFMEE